MRGRSLVASFVSYLTKACQINSSRVPSFHWARSSLDQMVSFAATSSRHSLIGPSFGAARAKPTHAELERISMAYCRVLRSCDASGYWSVCCCYLIHLGFSGLTKAFFTLSDPALPCSEMVDRPLLVHLNRRLRSWLQSIETRNAASILVF